MTANQHARPRAPRVVATRTVAREVFTNLAVAAGKIDAGMHLGRHDGAAGIIAEAIADLPGYKADKFLRHARTEANSQRADKLGQTFFYVVIHQLKSETDEWVEVYSSMSRAIDAMLDLASEGKATGITLATWNSSAPSAAEAEDELLNVDTKDLPGYREITIWSPNV